MRALLAVLFVIPGCSAPIQGTGTDLGPLDDPGQPSDAGPDEPVPDGVDAPPAPSCSPPAASVDPRWFRPAVGYEVFVRSFQDSDGDGKGDLPGLSSRLDYLNDGKPGEGDDLEVDFLWLMPIHPSPSYHGYDVTDYRDVNPEYGTLADFDALVAKARDRGVRVILDLVVNHTSDRHPWFQASASLQGSLDWYVWTTEAKDPKEWKQPWGSAKVWHASGPRWYYGVFSKAMPDLAFGTEAVTKEMLDVTRFWLERGAAGFRLDAVRYLVETGPGKAGQQDTQPTLDWWKQFSAAAHATRPDALLVGEAWADASVAAKYVAAGLDMTFDFDLASAMVGSVGAGDGEDLDRVLCRFGQRFPAGAANGVFLTNHDMRRVASEVADTQNGTRSAAALLFALPGTPFVYYGEEIGMTNGPLADDRHKRRPMQWNAGPGAGFTTGNPWEPVNEDAATVNVEAESKAPESLLSLYRKLIRVRHESLALSRGAARRVPATSPTTGDVWALARETGTETVVCVFNLGKTPAADVRLDVAPGKASEGRDLLDGTTFPVGPDSLLRMGDMAARSFRYVRLGTGG